MRAARRAAGPRLELEVERRGVTVERRAGTGAETTAAAVVASAVQGQDVPVEAHEHVRRRRKNVRPAKAGTKAVVRRLRLEDPHCRALAKLGQVAPKLEARRDPRGRPGGGGEQRNPKDDEGDGRDEPAHRGRLYALAPHMGMTEVYQNGR